MSATPSTSPDGRPLRRVLWVADNLTTGGIGTVSRYAAEALAQLPGWTVTLLSLRPAPSDRTEAATGVRHVSLGLGDDAALPFLDWLEHNPQDFVLTSHVPQIEPAFIHFPPRSLHIVLVHDTSRNHAEMALRNAASVDGIIAVAHHVAALLRPKLERAHYRGVIETIHNGAQYPAEPKRLQAQGPIRLLYVGSMDPFKGIFDLAQVLKRTRRLGVPATLTIAGGSNPILREQLRRHALDSFVAWTGWVDHHQCYELAAANDVLLMPSRKEAFGMVTIEAMAMGCVPIAYDIPSGSREIIEHGKSGLLIGLGDFAGCAAAIKRLHESPEDWRRLSLGAIQRARSSFTAYRMAMDLDSYLERVVENASSSPSRRKPGMPQQHVGKNRPRSGYQRLPSSVRERIRSLIGSSPRLCHWLLNRW